jgi:hypothetical protein
MVLRREAALSEQRSTGAMLPASGPHSGTAIQKATVEPWRDPDWQRLWLALQSRRWTSLGLVPAGTQGPEDLTLLVAVILSRTSMAHLGAPVPVADATKVPFSQLALFMEQVYSQTRAGNRIIVALPAPSKNPVTNSIVQALDAALLCVLVEETSYSEARKTIDDIGAERFLGSAIFHPTTFEPMKRERR